MRREAAFIVLLFCPLSGGCDGLFHIGTRNLLYEANLIKDSHIEMLYFTHLAHQAWADAQRGCPGKNYSADYACGFKDGFVDYLYAGGNGEPPALLPKRYLRFHEQKAHGCQGLLDWYAGFRHGAAVAHDSGLRQSLVIALPPPPAPHPPTSTAFIPTPALEENKPPLDPAMLPLPKKQAPEIPEAHGPDVPPAEQEEPVPEKQP